MNEEKHWNSIGGSYNSEIFDVFNSHKKKVLKKLLAKYSNQKHRAIDFGCGTGKAFPYLAPEFEHVTAIDISQRLLDQAQQSSYRNISYKQLDLTAAGLRLPKVEFVFCCNVAILPSREGNLSILRNIVKYLKPKGSAVVVVPSMESVLYSTSRLIEWYSREGVTVKEIPVDDLAYYRSHRKTGAGLIYIDGVPTKHYLKEELQSIFNQTKFKITSIQKLEYDWSTEFDSPPKWLGEPFPWDWCVTGTRQL